MVLNKFPKGVKELKLVSKIKITSKLIISHMEHNKTFKYECFNFDKNICMPNYDTVSAAINSLKERGYKTDFNIAFDKLICNETKVCLNPDEFEITEVYRFEGESNPSDEAVVYAVESKSKSMKGVMVNGYGIYADPMSDEMIKKLSIHRAV